MVFVGGRCVTSAVQAERIIRQALSCTNVVRWKKRQAKNLEVIRAKEIIEEDLRRSINSISGDG